MPVKIPRDLMRGFRGWGGIGPAHLRIPCSPLPACFGGAMLGCSLAEYYQTPGKTLSQPQH